MDEIRNQAGLTQREHRLATGIATECGFCDDGKNVEDIRWFGGYGKIVAKAGETCPYCHGSGLAPSDPAVQAAATLSPSALIEAATEGAALGVCDDD